MWGTNTENFRRHFATEEAISREISGALRKKLTPERSSARRSTGNVDAYPPSEEHCWTRRTEESCEAIRFSARPLIVTPPLVPAGLAEGYVPTGATAAKTCG
jgi:hypothetical protein